MVDVAARAVVQRDLDRVEVRSLRAPQSAPCQLDATRGVLARPVTDLFPVQRDADRLAAFSLDVDCDGAGLSVRVDAEAGDRLFGQRLEPHGLPDAGRGRVEDRLRLRGPVLLAARDRAVGERVLGAHNDLVVALARDSRYVRGEGRVPALVRGHLLPVDPDRGAVVDGAKMQQQLAGRRRVKGAPVPHDIAEVGLADAGQLRLRAEGNRDRAVEDARLAGAELPIAVEGFPFAPAQHRPRVLVPRRFSPDGGTYHAWECASPCSGRPGSQASCAASWPTCSRLLGRTSCPSSFTRSRGEGITPRLPPDSRRRASSTRWPT